MLSIQQPPKNVIGLEQAVKDVILARDDSRKSGATRSPFFFMVGAGISTPSIKMVADIQKDCMAEAERLNRVPKSIAKNPQDAYGQWFEAAFPHRLQRKRYLQSIIQDRPITHANFRLAHLLQENAITNIVATSNFDELLEQSLNILGQPYILADTSRTVDRIDPEEQVVQIIHIHGSYRFYDLRNTADEIDRQSRLAQDTPITMAALFDKIMAFQVPLVIGYGGWEKDVFMSALYRRLSTPLPYNLYWFCYKHSSLDTLPTWLKIHPDVYFVCPTLGTPPTINQQTAQSVLTQDRLESKDVFLGIENALKLTNQLIDNPLKHFSIQLTKCLPPAPVDQLEDVNLTLRNVVDRINRAVDSETRINKHFDATRNARENNKFSEAFKEASLLETDELTSHELTELIRFMYNGATPKEESERRLQAEMGRLAIKCFSTAISKGCIMTLESKRQVSHMANINGNVLLDLDKNYAEANKFYDQAIEWFDKEEDLNVAGTIAHVYNNKGISLRALKDIDAALNLHDIVISRHIATASNDLLYPLARAMWFKMTCLNDLKRHEEVNAVQQQAMQILEKMDGEAELTKNLHTSIDEQKKLADKGLLEKQQKSNEEIAVPPKT